MYVNRRQIMLFSLFGLGFLIIVIFLARCPPDACRILHIQTYTISTLDEYRHLLRDETGFTERQHARAIRIRCADLRDEVVTSLETGRLNVETIHRDGANERNHGPGSIKAWHQGRLLHLQNLTSEDIQVLNLWAQRVRAYVAEQQRDELAFLPRLFGGVVLHVHNRDIPIILFSSHPCI